MSFFRNALELSKITRQRLRWIQVLHPASAKPAVPYAMREKVEEELDRLVAEGTLEPVDYSDCAAPIIAVMKSDRKNVRLYGDFPMSINPVSKLNRYPIPKTEDIFATLSKEIIHQARPELGDPAAQAGGGVKQVRGYQFRKP